MSDATPADKAANYPLVNVLTRALNQAHDALGVDQPHIDTLYEKTDELLPPVIDAPLSDAPQSPIQPKLRWSTFPLAVLARVPVTWSSATAFTLQAVRFTCTTSTSMILSKPATFEAYRYYGNVDDTETMMIIEHRPSNIMCKNRNRVQCSVGVEVACLLAQKWFIIEPNCPEFAWFLSQTPTEYGEGYFYEYVFDLNASKRGWDRQYAVTSRNKKREAYAREHPPPSVVSQVTRTSTAGRLKTIIDEPAAPIESNPEQTSNNQSKLDDRDVTSLRRISRLFIEEDTRAALASVRRPTRWSDRDTPESSGTRPSIPVVHSVQP